jgi:peroxiredoxin
MYTYIQRAVVFSLPGAFTPTCSSTHLPGYEEEYEAITRCGIDDIYCLSVNDAFVMRQVITGTDMSQVSARTFVPVK